MAAVEPLLAHSRHILTPANEKQVIGVLHDTAARGDLTAVKVHIKQEVAKRRGSFNVDALDGILLRAPLHLAAEGGHEEVVRCLLEAGARPDVKDINGASPLHWAATAGQLAVVQMLMAAGADANLMDDYGDKAIGWAAAKGRLEVIQALLQAGASSVVPNRAGWTPLHQATASGYVDCINLLLEHGADYRATNIDGNTALHLACERNFLGAIERLAQGGAPLCAVNKLGQRPCDMSKNEYVQHVLQTTEYVKKAKPVARGHHISAADLEASQT